MNKKILQALLLRSLFVPCLLNKSSAQNINVLGDTARNGDPVISRTPPSSTFTGSPADLLTDTMTDPTIPTFKF